MTQDNRIQKIVIVGGGTAGWMAASMLAKTLEGNSTGDKANRIDITLIESDEIPIIGVGEATIPPIQLFNDYLGLDEDEFLRQTRGSFKLGIQFNNWGRLGDKYMHAFGTTGRPLGGVDFHHYWLKAGMEGGTSDLWDYSFNDKVARANKFSRMAKIKDSPLEGLTYAFHFDATLYAKYLRSYSERLGVNRIEGKVITASLRGEDGFISHLTMENGTEITGDFFIDCTGFRSLLIEETLKTGYVDWSGFLPCNRAIAVPTASVGDIQPYTRSTALSAGWQWHIPLQHRTGNGHVFCSDYISEDEATAMLLDNLEGETLADPRVVHFNTGRRRKFWNKNCVVLGLASGFMEPLESTSIHLFQSGITRLIKMFPDKSCSRADADEYNRQAISEFESIRDFIIFHYHATERTDTPFWRDCGGMDVPDSLTERLELFRTNGRIFRKGDELFSENSWLQVMIGQGIRPAGYHPLADQVASPDVREYLENIDRIQNRALSELPLQKDFIARNCSASRQL